MDISTLVKEALLEDIGSGDVTSDILVSEDKTLTADIIAKDDGIVCGLEIIKEVYKQLDPKININTDYKCGDEVKNGDVLCTITGSGNKILKGERTALNFSQHMSGVATLTAKYVKDIDGTGAKILDTRKTIPGFRELDKIAVKSGGGVNHRMGLYDMILIKENHIAAAGGVGVAVTKCKSESDLKVMVEVTNVDEVEEALDAMADYILLDNMNLHEMEHAVFLRNEHESNALLEASGGVNLETVREIAETGVDRISIGAITHSVPAFDCSLLVK